jgi:hypothetical protein
LWISIVHHVIIYIPSRLLSLFLRDFYRNPCHDLRRAWSADELERSETEPAWMSSKRRNLLVAFLKAWDEAPNRDNILSAFQTTGIHPFDPRRPLSSKYARPNIYPDGLHPFDPRDPTQMNSALATLEFLKRKGNRIIIGSLPDGESWTQSNSTQGCLPAKIPTGGS